MKGLTTFFYVKEKRDHKCTSQLRRNMPQTISSSKYQKESHKIQETKMLSFNQPLVLESSTAISKKKWSIWTPPPHAVASGYVIGIAT